MPRLPDYTSLGESPTPRSSLGRTSYRATHGAEAAPGQALLKIGNTLVNVGEEIERENYRVDTLRAEDAFNKLREKQQELSIGEDGFTKKRGGDAVNTDIIKDYSKRFEDSTSEIANGLGNERQKSLFKRRADIGVLQYKQDILGHVTREKDIYAKQTFQGILDTETSNAIERYRDPYGVAISITRINDAITREAERLGATKIDESGNKIDREDIKALRRDAASKIHRGIIERHLANEDDLSATAQYQKIKGTLNSEDTISVERALEVGSTRGQGQRLADKFMAKHDNNFGLAVEEARKIKNPKVREAALGNIRQAKSDDETKKKLDEDDAFTSAMQYVQQYGDVHRVPPNVLVGIGEDGQNTLEKMALEVREKRTPTTDPKVWAEFSEKSKDRKWLSGLTEKEFSGYLFSLDEEKRDRASSLRDAAIKAAKGDAKAKGFLRNDMNLDERIRTNMFDAGVMERKKTGKKYEPEEEQLIDSIKQEAEKQIEELQVAQKSKATSVQEREIVRKLILPHMKVKVKGMLWDSEKRRSEITTEERQDSYVEFKDVKIPIEQLDGIMARAKQLGVNPSQEQMARAYQVFIGSTKLPADDRRSRIDAILRGQ